MLELKKARAILYRPFGPLEKITDIQLHESYRVTTLKKIERLIGDGDWYGARKMSAELINTALDGLHYLQTYERFLIRGIVTFAYVGWAAYASLFIFRPLDQNRPHRFPPWASFLVNAVALATFIGFWALFAVQRSPWTFYIYITFPCYFWHQVLLQGIPALLHLPGYKKVDCLRVLLSTMASVAALQGMVVSYVSYPILLILTWQ